MPFVKGQVANPLGTNNKAGRDAVNKVRSAINKAIDKLKKGQTIGIEALSTMIADQITLNPVAALKALAPLLPKDILVEVQNTGRADSMSDDDLAELIAQNTVLLAKRKQEKQPDSPTDRDMLQ